MNHIEFAELESVMLHTTWDARFAAFLKDVADTTGLTDECGPNSLDGDRSADNDNPDPACLDELMEWFKDDVSVLEASEIIRDRRMDQAWRA